MLWVLRFRVTSPEEGFQESPLRLGFSVNLQKRAFKNPLAIGALLFVKHQKRPGLRLPCATMILSTLG